MKLFLNSSLKIQYNCGMDEYGKSIFKSKTYGFVQDGADETKLKLIATAIADLQDHTMEDVKVNENYSIM